MDDAQTLLEPAAVAEVRIRGPVMIMDTPLRQTGAVDFDALAEEVRFINRCGGQAVVWGQLDDTLDDDDRLRAMQVVTATNRGLGAKTVLGVQGRDTAEMLRWAKHAEALEPDWIISRPPNEGTSQDDYYDYYRALAGATRRPVIIQTSGGGGERLAPSTDLIIRLAREFPHFGHVKEEAPVGRPTQIVARHKALLAARPPMRSVLSANFGLGLLYEMRLGIDGLFTGSAMFTDVLQHLWALHRRGDEAALLEAYGRYLVMRSLSQQLPAADLYLWRKRGIAAHAWRRPNKDGGYTVIVPELSDADVAEIEYRYAALAPYLAA